MAEWKDIPDLITGETKMFILHIGSLCLTQHIIKLQTDNNISFSNFENNIQLDSFARCFNPNKKQLEALISYSHISDDTIMVGKYFFFTDEKLANEAFLIILDLDKQIFEGRIQKLQATFFKMVDEAAVKERAFLTQKDVLEKLKDSVTQK